MIFKVYVKRIAGEATVRIDAETPVDAAAEALRRSRLGEVVFVAPEPEQEYSAWVGVETKEAKP